jgi:hypothetical protein
VGPVALPVFPVTLQDPNRTISISGLGPMQNLLLTTKYVFSWWVHFLALNGAPTLQLAQIPNEAGNYVYPNETTIVSAVVNHRGSPDDLFIMSCTHCYLSSSSFSNASSTLSPYSLKRPLSLSLFRSTGS